MAELTDAATLAVLREMGWPDDRTTSAHIEPDGRELTPPGAYWDMAQDVAGAVISAMKAIIRADERAKVAEEIAERIDAELVCCDIAERIQAVANDSIAVTRLMDRGSGYHPICHWAGAAAAIARQHAGNGPRIAVEAPAAHAESHRMGEGSSGAQEAVG